MTTPTLLNRGAFADVFDLGDNTVVKVYRRYPQTHAPVRNWDDHEFIIRQLFARELTAYQKLQAAPDLLAFIPRFYGAIDCTQLKLESSSAGEPLMLECALRIEKLPGKDIKIAHVEAPLQQRIEAVLEEVRHEVRDIDVWDCSCFIPGPRAEFAVIDFALWEHLADLQCYLDEHGHIPEALRLRVQIR